MTRPDAGAGRRPTPLRRRPAATLLAALLLSAAAHAREGYELRYGLAPGQTWHAVQTVVSETSVGAISGNHEGRVVFRYDVSPGATQGELRLDARMLSQATREGPSPFDFSVIHFTAQTDTRGNKRGMYFELGDAEPPQEPGVDGDPVAFRQMLRSLASAWLESVYWLPVLPERPLAVGETFTLDDRGDVGGTDPGVAMQMQKKTTYRLRRVEGRLAEFDIDVRSTVDAATAQSGITSSLRAEGDAVFDLEAGMWLRQQIRAVQQAALRGAESGADRASARSVTTVEMRPGPPPAADAPPGT